MFLNYPHISWHVKCIAECWPLLEDMAASLTRSRKFCKTWGECQNGFGGEIELGQGTVQRAHLYTWGEKRAYVFCHHSSDCNRCIFFLWKVLFRGNANTQTVSVITKKRKFYVLKACLVNNFTECIVYIEQPRGETKGLLLCAKTATNLISHRFTRGGPFLLEKTQSLYPQCIDDRK